MSNKKQGYILFFQFHSLFLCLIICCLTQMVINKDLKRILTPRKKLTCTFFKILPESFCGVGYVQITYEPFGKIEEKEI